MITEEVVYVPAGIARYVGAGAVIKLTDTPSDAASGGVSLPADPVTGGDMRTIRRCDLIPTDVGVNATYLGEVPTATFGFDLMSGDSMRQTSRALLAAMQIYVPAGVTVHVRYGWGTR